MKAYRVWNVHDEWQEIVFARHHSTAKREVSAAYCPPDIRESEFYNDLRAEHLPHMDGYGHPFAKRGYIEQNSGLQRISGIFHCERCGGNNGDGNLLCAECEAKNE